MSKTKLDLKKYDPAQQGLLCDKIERENMLRLRWFQTHQDIVQKTATLSRESKNYDETDIYEHHMIACLPALTKAHETAARHKFRKLGDPVTNIVLKTGHSIADVGLGDPKADPRLVRADAETQPGPIMRPVEPKVRALLYKTDYGSKQYIKKRLDLDPEEKYYFPETSNFEYGWRIKDSAVKRGPSFGVVNHMNTQNSRVGPGPDPTHYNRPEAGGVFNRC